MTVSRILCPLDCGWHHDQEDPTPDPSTATMPLPTPDLAYMLSLGRLHAVEGILRAHLETHELIEWVTALTTAQRQLAAQAGTCDASATFGALATVGPCILRRDHVGPVHEAANGATWTIGRCHRCDCASPKDCAACQRECVATPATQVSGP